MSILHKFIFGLIALMCLLQLVEMSRIRRDDTAAVGQPGNMDIGSTIESLMEKFKGLVDEDKLKEILNTAADALTEGAKKFKEQIK